MPHVRNDLVFWKQAGLPQRTEYGKLFTLHRSLLLLRVQAAGVPHEIVSPREAMPTDRAAGDLARVVRAHPAMVGSHAVAAGFGGEHALFLLE